MSASYEHLLQQSPPALQQDASSIWGARCMVGRVVLISALMDPLAAQRAISSIATEWAISALFQSKEARGLARGLARGRGVCASLWKPQEAGRPCCKGPHQVMCATFIASCSYAQKAIAVMAKSDDQVTCLFEHSFDLHSLLGTFWPLVRSHLLKPWSFTNPNPLKCYDHYGDYHIHQQHDLLSQTKSARVGVT